MTAKPRIALIIGSTRPTRFADTPTQWMRRQAEARDDMDVDVVDLRDHPMPFFDEATSNLWAPSVNPEAVRWQQTIGQYDGYIFVVAELTIRSRACLGSGLTDQSQKMTVAARAMAEKKALGHRS
jgi:NAD(P)H-dependent FMN reductase